MVSISLNIKGKTHQEVLELLKNLDQAIQSSDWTVKAEQSIELVHSDGEGSLTIVNNEEEYHGVKVNCCG